jgi:hypothetical protein
VSTDGRSWSMAVQVVVASDALVTLPTAAGNTSSWEAGALLHRDDGAKPQEFMARSTLRVTSLDAKRQYIVHEHILKKVKPGNWQLGAFIRDKNAALFGGAATELNLPRPGEAGLSTPVLYMRDRITHRTSLPELRTKNDLPMTQTRATTVQSLAAGTTSIQSGDPIEIQSWVCAPKNRAADQPMRFLTNRGKPVFRFKKYDPPAAGTCSRIVDEIDTGFLLPGEYTYHVRYGIIETELPLALQ